MPIEALDRVRDGALDQMCSASLAGLPQLAMPAIATAEGPVGLGIIAAAKSDMALLSLAMGLIDRRSAT